MPELQEVIDNLVKAVAARESELEKLAKEYQEKLNVLNSYIDQFQQLSNDNLESQDEQKIQELLSAEISCPLCHANLYKLDNDSEFLLVPKLKVKSILRGTLADKANAADSLKATLKSLQISDQLPQTVVAKKLHRPKKMTCSYCKKLGHSRARCFTRLSQDPSEGKAGGASAAVMSSESK